MGSQDSAWAGVRGCAQIVAQSTNGMPAPAGGHVAAGQRDPPAQPADHRPVAARAGQARRAGLGGAVHRQARHRRAGVLEGDHLQRPASAEQPERLAPVRRDRARDQATDRAAESA